MACVGSFGSRVSFADGDALFREGEKNFPFFVVDQGEVHICEHSSGSQKCVTVHAPREFVGDVALLTDRSALVSAFAKGNCTTIRVERPVLRQMLAEMPELSDLLLQAFQARRRLLESSGFVGVRLIGAEKCKITQGIRDFFYKNHVPHTMVEATSPQGQTEIAAAGGATYEELPLVLCNGTVAKSPPLTKIAECLGISRQIEEDKPYDLVIVGAGPSGIAASVYGASEGLRILVVDSVGPGGQAASSSRIENFMGFPAGISGAELANLGYLQALKFGAQFSAPATVRSLERDEKSGELLLELCTGQTARTQCALISTGVSYRQLDLEGGDRFEGEGLYYAATSIQASICRDCPVVVVGGGNSAGQAAMFLAEHASKVVLVLRGDDLGKSMSEYLCRRIRAHDRIEVRYHTRVASAGGNGSLEHVEFENNETGERKRVDCAGVFVFIGAKPHTDWLPKEIKLDNKGFVLTGSLLESDPAWPLDRPPCDLETTLPGVLAAGDVRAGTTKRCGFAVGDGALAISCAHRVLSGL